MVPDLVRQLAQRNVAVYPTIVDHGNTGIFRFGDYKFVATQENSNRTTNSEAAAGTAAGVVIGNLLNALFNK
jgi:hypothetical protein